MVLGIPRLSAKFAVCENSEKRCDCPMESGYGKIASLLVEAWLRAMTVAVWICRTPLPGLQCRRQDLNLHWVNPNQALNLARLPIPPLRHGFRIQL